MCWPLPLPVLRGMGVDWGVCCLCWRARAAVALRNFELCFPDVPEAQRKAWAKSFVVFCQTFLDAAGCGSAPRRWCAAVSSWWGHA
jgi:lauroyl/myristoyl acyltransferase